MPNLDSQRARLVRYGRSTGFQSQNGVINMSADQLQASMKPRLIPTKTAVPPTWNSRRRGAWSSDTDGKDQN